MTTEILSPKKTSILLAETAEDATNAPIYFKMANTYARKKGYARATRVTIGETFAIGETVSAGYRKNSNGEYVHKAYRRHFGWKNTHYQPLIVNITVPRIQAEAPAPTLYYIVETATNIVKTVLHTDRQTAEAYYSASPGYYLTDSPAKERASFDDNTTTLYL